MVFWCRTVLWPSVGWLVSRHRSLAGLVVVGRRRDLAADRRGSRLSLWGVFGLIQGVFDGYSGYGDGCGRVIEAVWPGYRVIGLGRVRAQSSKPADPVYVASAVQANRSRPKPRPNRFSGFGGEVRRCICFARRSPAGTSDSPTSLIIVQVFRFVWLAERSVAATGLFELFQA